MVARHNAPRAAPRGPAANRRSGARADRDGDVSMGIAIKGRGAISKTTAVPKGPRKDLTPRSSRGGILSQRDILRKAAASDVSMKEARISTTGSGLVELKVTGWENSKASGDADRGVSSLIKWLEKKASTRLGSRVRSVKVKKSHVEGTDLIIKVVPEDVGSLVRMNGYGWAGTSINIERLGGPVRDSAPPSSQTEKTKALLRGVLERRYNFETKFLDLSNLALDEELKNEKVFDQKSTASKFFPAMMKVLDMSFDKPEEKDAAVLSVSLANNELQDLVSVSTLSETLPKLQNLDLSNNKFENLSALGRWRRRFHHLQHLIVTGNPLEQNEGNYAAQLVNWYSTLRMLNNVQVRTEEEVAKRTHLTELPFPIRSPLFQDEGGIAEQFVRNFYTGFDNDRPALAAAYYDDKSDFSYAVNTQAPRDPDRTDKIEQGEWSRYTRSSRNLKQITQLPARQSRLYHGTKAVTDIFASLPKTRHPDLASEARKWMIEAKMVPGVPDPTGQSPAGVDGFKISIHGEFDEIDANGQALKKRSFDRAFILGPGAGPGGVRVVSDLLTIRGYGGTQAFEADHMDGWNTDPTQVNQAVADVVPSLPAGITVQIAEQMVAELCKQTNMTLQYSKDCLDQVAWNFDAALEAFGRVRGSLPAEAFAQPA